MPVTERVYVMQQRKRTPSNRMPPYERLPTPMRVLLGLTAVFVAITWASGRLYPAVFVTAAILLAPPLLILRRRVRARRRKEGQQSICKFARSFDCRNVDTWIIRAVFDVLHQWRTVPLTASTRLEEDLALDPEDMEELSLIVHQRVGRPFDSLHSPLFTGTTVGELVAWFQSLPQRPRPAS